MNREQILRLQRELIAQHYLSPGDDDGSYGQKTRDAEARRNSDLQARQSQTQQTNAEANKTNAAAALATAQATQAKANVEVAKLQQEIDQKKTEQAVTQKKQQEIEAYQKTPEGFWLGLGKNVGAPLAGLGFGMLEAAAPRAIETAIGTSRNAQRKALGNQAEAIDFSNPSEAIPRAQAIAAEARANNLLPSETAASRVGPFLGRLAPGLLVGAPLIGEGLYQRFVGSNDPSNTPANRDELLALSNFLTAGGFGTVAGAGRYAAAGPATVPDSESISKIRQAEGRANLLQAAQDQAAKQPVNALSSATPTKAQPDIINALASYKAQQPSLPAPQPDIIGGLSSYRAPETVNPEPALPEAAPVEPQAAAAETRPQSTGLRAPADRLKSAVAAVGGPRGLAKGDAIDFLNDHLGGDNPARGAIARELGVTNGPNLQQRLLDKLEELKTSRKAYSFLGPAGAMIGTGLALAAGSDDAKASPLERVGNALSNAADAIPYAVAPEAMALRDAANFGDSVLPGNRGLGVTDQPVQVDKSRPGWLGREIAATNAQLNLEAARAEDARQRSELARTGTIYNALGKYAPSDSLSAAVTMARTPVGGALPQNALASSQTTSTPTIQNLLSSAKSSPEFDAALADFLSHAKTMGIGQRAY